MERTYLIQRLTKPKNAPAQIANMWSFGCTNGFLSKEALDLCHTCFDFDYMGAAEFEFGAIPLALKTMNEKKLVCGVIKRKIGKHNLQWNKEDRETTQRFFYISPIELEEYVKKYIYDFILGNKKENEYGRFYLKEGISVWDNCVVGWLELDNGFMFFRDGEMFNKTKELFKSCFEVK